VFELEILLCMFESESLLYMVELQSLLHMFGGSFTYV